MRAATRLPICPRLPTGARAGMADAVALGLFGGTQDTGGRVWLRPGESATRAEIAAVLARFGRNVAHLL